VVVTDLARVDGLDGLISGDLSKDLLLPNLRRIDTL
jgi:hypothetical protein